MAIFITTNKPTSSFFTGQMPFLSPNQQCQSTEVHWTVKGRQYTKDIRSGSVINWKLLDYTYLQPTQKGCDWQCSSDIVRYKSVPMQGGTFPVHGSNFGWMIFLTPQMTHMGATDTWTQVSE